MVFANSRPAFMMYCFEQRSEQKMWKSKWYGLYTLYWSKAVQVRDLVHLLIVPTDIHYFIFLVVSLPVAFLSFVRRSIEAHSNGWRSTASALLADEGRPRCHHGQYLVAGALPAAWHLHEAISSAQAPFQELYRGCPIYMDIIHVKLQKEIKHQNGMCAFNITGRGYRTFATSNGQTPQE